MADGLTIWPLVRFFFIMADGLPLADDPTYLTLADGLSWPTALLSGRLPYSNSGRRPILRPTVLFYFTLANGLVLPPIIIHTLLWPTALLSGRRRYSTLLWPTAVFWMAALFHIILVDDLLSDNYYYQAKGLGR